LRTVGVAAAAALMIIANSAMAQEVVDPAAAPGAAPASPPPPQDDGPFTAEKVTASARAQYGFSLQGGTINPYALGLGARGGYTLDFALYLGGSLDWYSGTSNSVLGNTISGDHWQVLADVGYDLALTPDMVLRPLGNIGVARKSMGYCFEETGVCGEKASNAVVLGLGAEYLYSFGMFNIGADLRFNGLAANTTKSTFINLGVVAGATF